jgi:putative membrane protein
MRFALILSLLLAVLAVMFALMNPGYMDVKIGPGPPIHGSTALILMITFGIGVLVGLLATLPSAIRRGRRVKSLEREKGQIDPDLGKPYTSSDFDYVPPKKGSAL